MQFTLEEAIDRFSTLEIFQEVLLPVTPIPRLFSDESGFLMPPIKEANVPVGQNESFFKRQFEARRQAVFGKPTEKHYSLGDVTAYLASEKPHIIQGETAEEGFDPYVVYSDVAPSDLEKGKLVRQALYQASLARSTVNACVMNFFKEDLDEEFEAFLERPLVIDPFSPIHLQAELQDRVIVFADRESDVRKGFPKTLSPASTFALLLYSTSIYLDERNWRVVYENLFESMPEEKRVMYDQFVAILRDDQFGGHESEFNAPGPDRQDVLPSDPFYALIHLNDALYRMK